MDKQKSKKYNTPFLKKYPLIFKKYKPIKKIAKGAFSEIYSGINIFNREKVALKIEKRNIMNKLLESECYLLFSINNIGIPKVLTFGHNKEYDILIMPLLGKTLLDIFVSNNLNYEFKDICLIAIQIIERIQWVHCSKIIHRDIKPDNFLIGLNDPHIIYLIDFGLSKKYQSSVTGKHIKYGKVKKFTGTTLFGSANALMCMEQSRRDDLESIGYMLIYFMKGTLPWQGIKVDNKKESYLKISQIKKNITPEKLCGNLPNEFADYIKYVKNLKFDELPNYNYLRNLFVQMMKKQGFEEGTCFFSWVNLNNINIRNIKRQINLSKKSSSRKRIINKIRNNLENSKRSFSEKKSDCFIPLEDPNKNFSKTNVNSKEKDNTYESESNNNYYINNHQNFKYSNDNLNNQKIIKFQKSILIDNSILRENNNNESNCKNLNVIASSIDINKKNNKVLLNSFPSVITPEITKKKNFLNENNYNYVKKNNYCLNEFKNRMYSPKNSSNNFIKKNPNKRNKTQLIIPDKSHKRICSITDLPNQKTILIRKNSLNSTRNNNNSYINKKNINNKKINNNIYIINNNIYKSNNLSHNKKEIENNKNIYYKIEPIKSQKQMKNDNNINNIKTQNNKNFGYKNLRSIKIFNLFNQNKKNNNKNISLQPNVSKENSAYNNSLKNEIKRFNKRYNNQQLSNNRIKKIKIPRIKLTIQNSHYYKSSSNKINKNKFNSTINNDNNCNIF